MTLEFEKDSPELNQFVKELKYIDRIMGSEEGDLDDYHTFEAVYEHLPTNKLYQVEVRGDGGIYSKLKFISYRRNFLKSEPYVVSFQEVKPIERTYTDYIPVEDDGDNE